MSAHTAKDITREEAVALFMQMDNHQMATAINRVSTDLYNYTVCDHVDRDEDENENED